MASGSSSDPYLGTGAGGNLGGNKQRKLKSKQSSNSIGTFNKNFLALDNRVHQGMPIKSSKKMGTKEANMA